MNKESIAELLDNYVSGIDERFGVSESFGDLIISVENDHFASFAGFEISRFDIIGSMMKDALIAKTGIIQKFYIKACELLEKLDEKEYTIQIIKGCPYSYLNLRKDNNYKFSDNEKTSTHQVTFTQSEIEKLKQRDDIAIDWDKAIIKEVEE